MKIEIMGGKCANCARFTQYYCYSSDQILSAIDSGYCSRKSRNVRPGDRCREYQSREKRIVGNGKKCEDCQKYAPFYCAWMKGEPKEIGCGYCINNLKTVNPGDVCGEWLGK